MANYYNTQQNLSNNDNNNSLLFERLQNICFLLIHMYQLIYNLAHQFNLGMVSILVSLHMNGIDTTTPKPNVRILLVKGQIMSVNKMCYSYLRMKSGAVCRRRDTSV